MRKKTHKVVAWAAKELQDTVAGFPVQIWSKLLKTFEMSIKHNCETTTLPTRDDTWQKTCFSHLVSSYSRSMCRGRSECWHNCTRCHWTVIAFAEVSFSALVYYYKLRLRVFYYFETNIGRVLRKRHSLNSALRSRYTAAFLCCLKSNGVLIFKKKNKINSYNT